MAEPKIYSRNFVDENATLAFSSNSADGSKIIDGDKNSKWISSGENSDADEATIQVDFNANGSPATRTIDTIVVVNHNLKAPTLEYWDGAAWQTLATGVALAVSTSIFTFSAQATTKIRIRCSTTQIVDAEKFVGLLFAVSTQVDLGKDLNANGMNHREKANEIMLGDGSLHRAIIMNSPTRSDKYEARVQFQFLTASQADALKAVKAGGEFVWQPESEYRPDEIYTVNWVGPFKYKYMTAYKGAGFQIDLDLKEA